jgi:hypothetical protein
MLAYLFFSTTSLSFIFGSKLFSLELYLTLNISSKLDLLSGISSFSFCSIILSWSWMCSSSGLNVVSDTYFIIGRFFLILSEVLVNWLLTTSGILGKDSSWSSIFWFLRFRWAARAYINYNKIIFSAIILIDRVNPRIIPLLLS